jgi:hypothetical protein
MEGSDAGGTPAARFGEALVGGVGLSQNALAVDGQPGVEGVVLPPRRGKVGFGEGA